MVCSFTLIFYCRLLFYWFSLLLGSSVNDLKFPEPAEHSLSNSTHNLFDSGAFRGGWNHRLVIHSFCLQGVQYQADACGVNRTDRKSTRLNSSHVAISYAVFCLKKKNQLHAGVRL